MPRIKLVIPERSFASVIIPVRVSDINYGNHVGNDAFVSILQEARMQWLQSHGYTELNIEGLGLIMSDLAIEYKSESFYGDTIEVTLSAGEITNAGFEIFYRLFTRRNGETMLLAKAKTGMVCYDYGIKKVSVLPEKLKHLLMG